MWYGLYDDFSAGNPTVYPPFSSPGVAGCVVNEKNEFLLVQEKWLRNKSFVMWKFPGGLANLGKLYIEDSFMWRCALFYVTALAYHRGRFEPDCHQRDLRGDGHQNRVCCRPHVQAHARLPLRGRGHLFCLPTATPDHWCCHRYWRDSCRKMDGCRSPPPPPSWIIGLSVVLTFTSVPPPPPPLGGFIHCWSSHNHSESLDSRGIQRWDEARLLYLPWAHSTLQRYQAGPSCVQGQSSGARWSGTTKS